MALETEMDVIGRGSNFVEDRDEEFFFGYQFKSLIIPLSGEVKREVVGHQELGAQGTNGSLEKEYKDQNMEYGDYIVSAWFGDIQFIGSYTIHGTTGDQEEVNIQEKRLKD